MTLHIIEPSKFAIIPVGNDEQDALYYDSYREAKDSALQWSVEIYGKSVAILERDYENDDYEIITQVCA